MQKKIAAMRRRMFVCLLAAGILLTSCQRRSYLQRVSEEPVIERADSEDGGVLPASAKETESASGGKDTVPSETETGSGAAQDGLDHPEVVPTTDAGQIGDSETGIYVQVLGAVVTPGVYLLPEGSRVFVLLEVCGGLTEEADAEAVNQVRELRDGEQIRVPTKEETAAGLWQTLGGVSDSASEMFSSSEEDTPVSYGKIDLNTAGISELMTLPGIGEAKAEAIVSYRSEHGAFQEPKELMKVTGIKEATFEKLKDLVVCR